MQTASGVATVIPVWYPLDTTVETAERLLQDTLSGSEIISDPALTVLVVDGQPRWTDLVTRMAEGRGMRTLVLAHNVGKGGALAAGIQHLAEQQPEWVLIRDSDGDCRALEAPALVELARQMTEDTGNPLILVAGGRADRHRPLGAERGEFELITDRVVWQALRHHAARAGRYLSGTYFAAHGDVPDLQSGFKCYSWTAAELVARCLSQGSGSSVGRWGVETVPAVEIVTNGGIVGVVSRLAEQEPAVSGFRAADLVALYGEPLAWVFLRLGLGTEVATGILDDALLRSRVAFDLRRREDVVSVRQAALAPLGPVPPMHWGARFV